MYNNDNEKNIVTPEKVDLNKVQVNNNDNMLNRERDNIVSATIQANRAIDKDKARNVNDSIKVKKMNPVVMFFSVTAVLLIAALFSVIVLQGVKKAMTFDDVSTSTTTTTKQSEKNIQIAYLNDFLKVRKYQSSTQVLLLSPKSYDMVNNKYFYMLITLGEKEPKSIEYGTYFVKGDTVKLEGHNEKTIKELSLTENGLTLNNDLLKKFDTEMKYYQYQGTSEKEILIINGTLYNEYALYITTNSSITEYNIYDFEETKEYIKLENGYTFTKDGMNVLKDNKTYNLTS